MKLFKITVTKWSEHNKSARSTFKKTMISNSIVTDAKVLSLPVGCRWLFVCLILLCGENGKDTVTLTERQINDMLSTKLGAQNGLDLLQSFQMVSYEIVALNKGSKGKKGKEEKELKEVTAVKPAAPEVESRPTKQLDLVPDPDPPTTAPNTGALIALYCDLWKKRYQAEKSPPVLAQHAKQLKKFQEPLGFQRASALVTAYLAMPDSWFVTKSHDIPTFLGNLNKISQFLDTGRMMTRTEVQQLDKAATAQNTLEALRRGDV